MLKLKTLIEQSGGVVNDIFVMKPGCQLIRTTSNCAGYEELYNLCNIDMTRPEYEQNAEFAARLTYMSFPSEKKSAQQFNEDMVKKYGHLSVYGDYYVTFLLAGITIETVLELVSTSEAKVSRLTTSKTRAMDETFYRIFPDECINEQMTIVKKFILLRNKTKDFIKDREVVNMFNLGIKVGALTFSMSIKDFHKFFIGRLSANNEKEMKEICAIMCDQLHALYPLVIKTSAEYEIMTNHHKYSF